MVILVYRNSDNLLWSYSLFTDDKEIIYICDHQQKIFKYSVNHSQIITIFVCYYSNIDLYIDSWYD